MKFPFNEPKNFAIFTCKHVLENDAVICYVSHDEEDGAWQFLCNAGEHIELDVRIISLEEAYDIDNSIAKIANIPLGYVAIRGNKEENWQVFSEI